MHALLADPWVRARVDAAVEPYRHILSSEDLAFLRDELCERMSADELVALALRRARPREVDESGEAFVGRIEHEHEAKEPRPMSSVASSRNSRSSRKGSGG